MRTRRGLCYTLPEDEALRKRPRRSSLLSSASPEVVEVVDSFDGLHDDLVLLVLSKLVSSAASPADLIHARLTCKRFNELALRPIVLSQASPGCLAVRATRWCDSAHRFLRRCVLAGNLDACYILGMIRFYCLASRGSGAALMAKAAIGNHASSLYSLAVIQFNGSGGSKNDRDLRAGVALCARAAALGHVDALRELGHCLQDGYGVRRSAAEGRRLLVHANARELAAAISSTTFSAAASAGNGKRHVTNDRRAAYCSILYDYGWHIAGSKEHPANKFLIEWFAQRGSGEGLRMCSYSRCGRPETRSHEFRRCSVCGVVNYCSRACQALHWKLVHKAECSPMDRWLDAPMPDAGAAAFAAMQ